MFSLFYFRTAQIFYRTGLINDVVFFFAHPPRQSLIQILYRDKIYKIGPWADFARDSRREPTRIHPLAACRLHVKPKPFDRDRKNEISWGAQNSGNHWQSYCKTSGRRKGLPARTAGALSSYRIFGTLSVFKRLITDKDLSVGERWPEKIAVGVDGAFIQWSGFNRKSGQRPVIIFSRSFLVRFFHRLGKNWTPTRQWQPTAD